jgi:hypothetical protein
VFSAADYILHTERKHPGRMWEKKLLDPDTTLEEKLDSPATGPPATYHNQSSSGGEGIEYYDVINAI